MANDIVCENSKPGNPPSEWDVSTQDAGDPTIQGFATDISVAQGDTISFKIRTDAAAYRLDIYRMGYYQGNGARLIATINPSVSLPQTQPACETDSATNLYDCGNWAVSASWTVPPNATSGIYFVHLVRADTGGDSHIVFVVRNDSSYSDVLFQTSDETWEAYNDWGGTTGVLGGHTLYGGPGAANWSFADRAYKVSYNRPYDTRSFESASWVFNNEYPMIRFLEANGFDVTYFTHVDGIRNADLILNHRLYMSTGHDEYWSGDLRANIEAARDAGMNLAFFSGNEVFWKTRWENSTDGSNTPYRTMVCYKETFSESAIDPADPPTWTGTWRDPTLSPPADGGRPENGLTGTLFMVNGPGTDNNGLSIEVPAADGKMRFWRNTSEASLAAGATATLPAGTLGFEWDVDADNGARPAGDFDLSTATYNLTTDLLVDNGVTYGGGSATHHMTMYRAPSGALVFGAGTVQWSWGLDSNHDNNFGFATPPASQDMQQATINLFADMGVQPATLQTGLVAASPSADVTPPSSTITSPVFGSDLPLDVPVTISGTATDAGGGVVGGVEVSVDGGQSWHPATGRENWTYSFTPVAGGWLTLRSRAVDDSGNIEIPNPGVTVAVGPTYNISGTVNPSAAGAGATVTLGGSFSATVVADSSGNYAFSGLASGAYGVEVSRAGYSFSPASSAVTINTSDVAGVDFAGVRTYSISGWIDPSTYGAGATVTLSGSAVGSVVADTSGHFDLAGLSNGAYTLTPSGPGLSFSPAQTTIAISGADVTGVVFTASTSLFTFQTPVLAGQSDGPGADYELGMAFHSDVAGQITGVRFWKDASETGMHTGNIWSATGTLLATVTFSSETASGWQVQSLATPLAIAANTVYVVSVNTGNTYYVDTDGGFASQITNHDLSSIVGNNGVFGYSGQFPTNSWDASNYFRDVVFAPNTTQSYSISGAITVGGATVTLSSNGTTLATTTASGSGLYSFGNLPSGTYTVAPSLTGYSFSPTSASVSVSGASVTGVNFTASSSVASESLFTTQTPAAIGNSDGPGADYELGMAFQSDTSGQITGIRFWKDANETGTHTGNIWSATGTLLATVTFSNETASGWQVQSLPAPLAIGANTIYVVSVDTGNTYYVDTNNGLASQIANQDLSSVVGNNGVFGYPGQFPTNSWDASNYFRDVVFLPDTVATYAISGTASGIGGATVTLTSNGATVATTTADGSGFYSFGNLPNGAYTVTPSLTGYSFSPSSASVSVSGASVAGVNFTASLAASSESLFTTQTPTSIGNSDGPGADYELGMAFQSDTSGQIAGIRFWKDANETGTHIGNIWSATGTLLATVTFSSETPSGWQVQSLPSPLAISANTPYVVSVNTGNTYYVASDGGLSSPITNQDLSSVTGNNGVFGYAGQFPTNSWDGSNYFRDVVFLPSGP